MRGKWFRGIALGIAGWFAVEASGDASPPAEQRFAVFVPMIDAPCWQDFAYLAAVPATKRLNTGCPAAVALDEHATVTPEVKDWLERFRPTECLQVAGASDPARRPRAELNARLVSCWRPSATDWRRPTRLPYISESSADWSASAPGITRSGPFTIGCWVKVSKAPPAETLLVRQGEVESSGWSLGITPSRNACFKVVRSDDGIVEICTSAQKQLTIDEWHHIAGVMDSAGTMRLYVDGRMQYFLPLGTSCKVSPATLTHAELSPAVAMDDVRLYERALSDEELGLIAEHPLAASSFGVAGATIVPGHTPAAVAAWLSARAWPQSARVVLVNDSNYADALVASSLAARLDVPLLYVGAQDVPNLTRAEIKRLATTSGLAIGGVPEMLPLPITRLADTEAVCRWLRSQKLDCDYVAAANPRDRQIGMVRKASLAAPLLAAAHAGIVKPLDFATQAKLPLWCDLKQPEFRRPAGAVSGIRAWGATEGWVRDVKTPKLAQGFQSKIYPVDGVYIKRDFAPYHPKMVLASATPGTVHPDRVLIDVNGNEQFELTEVFAAGDSFVVPAKSPAFHSPWPIKLRVVGLHADKRTQSVELEWNAWLVGQVRIDGRERAFAISSQYGFGFDMLHLDLNKDGRFDGPGEGPLHTMDVVHMDDRDWSVVVNHHYGHHAPGHAHLTYPAPQTVRTELAKVYQALGRDPEYLCLVGLHDVIPQDAITDSASHTSETPTDSSYGNVDADPFQDMAVGRVVADRQ